MNDVFDKADRGEAVLIPPDDEIDMILEAVDAELKTNRRDREVLADTQAAETVGAVARRAKTAPVASPVAQIPVEDLVKLDRKLTPEEYERVATWQELTATAQEAIAKRDLPAGTQVNVNVTPGGATVQAKIGPNFDWKDYAILTATPSVGAILGSLLWREHRAAGAAIGLVLGTGVGVGAEYARGQDLISMLRRIG